MSAIRELSHSELADNHTMSREGTQRQYLTFLLGGDVYALDILCIREIIEYGCLTEVPMMPSFIRGVINLRGSVVPVIDLAARFGRVRSDVHRHTCIVIVEVDAGEVRQEMGIVVDAVNEVLEILPHDVEPSPRFGARIRADFIQGMGKVNDKFVIILDGSRVLSVEEMGTLAQVNGSLAGASTKQIDGVDTAPADA